ncbi:MAG: tetratricopeptide repeat protein [Verrucomicrobiota bacterium]
MIRGILLIAAFAGAVGWLAWRTLKRSDDPPVLIVRWICTGLVLALMVRKVIPFVADGGAAGAYLGIPLTAVCGLLLAVIWRHSITRMIAAPFGSLYDGGSREPDPQPLYSLAQAHRNRGRYTEAVAEIRRQLDRFPTDVEGLLLLAAVQAENLNDLPGATLVIQRICNQPGHPPRNIALALNTLADWQLKYALDPDAARETLERIPEMLPGTEFAALAAQRIAHLASMDSLVAAQEPRTVALPQGIDNIGLLQPDQHPQAPSVDPGARAAELVKQIERHPRDADAREELAKIYAGHFDRLDLAADQLDQLIMQPDQPAGRVVGWLNLLADLQVRHGADLETVRHTVSRIGQLYPGSAAAYAAESRLARLKLELKGREKPGTVKLGTYEQNIGLKGRLPNQL